LNIQTISKILLNEDNPELHMGIIRDIDSQGLSSEEATFILSRTNNSVSHHLLSALAYFYLGDYNEAIHVLDGLVVDNQALAMSLRAHMYKNGQGTPGNQPNYLEAIALLDKAMAQGDTTAMVELTFMYLNGQGTLDGKSAYVHVMNLTRKAVLLNYSHREEIKKTLIYLVEKEYVDAEYFLFVETYKHGGYFPQDKNAALNLFKKHPVEHFISYCNECIEALRQDDFTEELYEHQVVCLNELQDNIPEHQQTPIVQAARNRFLANSAFFLSGDIQTAYETFRLIPQEYLSAHDFFELSNMVWMNPAHKNHRDTALLIAIELTNYAIKKAPADTSIYEFSYLLNQLYLKRDILSQEEHKPLSSKEEFQLNTIKRQLNLASQQILSLKRYQRYLQGKDEFESEFTSGGGYGRWFIWGVPTPVINFKRRQTVVSTLIQQLDLGSALETLLELQAVKDARAEDVDFNNLLTRLSNMSFLPALDNESEGLNLGSSRFSVVR
jgi:tetratricopeptide (TPR) repeat protein